MERASMLTELIVAVTSQVRECPMEDVQAALPGCTWNQILSEVDRMSRTGLLRLTKGENGSYRIRLAEGQAQDCILLAGDQQARPS